MTTKDSPVYNELNRAWKSTCKIVLKGEVGELNDFEQWLRTYTPQSRVEKSAVSGKEVRLAVKEYCGGAKFIGLDEVDFGKKFEPLNINEVKDIDNIAGALQERVYYTGNIVLGKSNLIEQSTSVQNSNYVYKSEEVFDSNRLAYSYHTKLCDSVFGGEFVGADTKFCIRVSDTYMVMRCLETWNSRQCSDCYYVFGIEGSQECMFSFNLRSKKYCIGNLPLEKDAYLKIKDKLLSEIREKLSKEKGLLVLIDLLAGAKNYRNELDGLFAEMKSSITYKDERKDKQKINNAFEETTQIVLGKKLGDMDAYSKWLVKHMKPLEFHDSVISGRKTTVRVGSGNFELFPKNRIVTAEEANVLGERLRLSMKEVEGLDLENAKETVGKIAYSNLDYEVDVKNCIECATPYFSRDCYRVGIPAWANESAYSFWPRNANHMFGTDSTNTGSFCIHTYFSVNLSRAFEADNCTNCTDIYFAHNCENVRNSMFCFNAKNLTNAIGNAVLPADQYGKIKISLVQQIADELERKKGLEWDIYNIGCVKG